MKGLEGGDGKGRKEVRGPMPNLSQILRDASVWLLALTT